MVFILLISTFTSKAAFPIKDREEKAATATHNSTVSMQQTIISDGFMAGVSDTVKHQPEERVKSQLAAGLLCYFFGVLGIHRFYLGYTWQGFLQLLMYPAIIWSVNMIGNIKVNTPGYNLIYPISAVLAFGIAMYVWQWVDLIRIIVGTLKPLNGKYR